MSKKIVVLLFVFIGLLQSCDTTEPTLPPPPPEEPKVIFLKLVNVSCTEAFITITANDTLLPVNITLNKNDVVLFNFTLTVTDTTIIDTTLQPNKTYTYQATAEINGETKISDTLQVKTLAPTSDNFVWQKYTFGDGASSIFRDVAIIDENNIWAVGAVYMNDSLGNPDPQAYNVIHWDGNQWELKRIQFYTICGQQNRTPYPAKGIFAFNENDIWIAMYGDQLAKVDGNNQTETICLPYSFSISKIWGTSDNDLYVVGNNGNIAHYNGTSWQKIVSGIELNIVDILGDINPFTNKTEIICGAANIFVNPGSELIRIKEDLTTEILDNTGLGQTFAPLWFKAGIRYYVVGDGLYEKTYKDTSTWKDLNSNRAITQYFMECIRGSELNNIIVAGAFGEVIHFNGISWKSIKNAETTLNNGSYYKVAVKGNVTVAVGFDESQAVILLGHQQ